MSDSLSYYERMLAVLDGVATDAAHFRRVTYKIQVDNYYRMAS